MITEAETFKLKNKVLEEIAVLFEAQVRSGAISNDEEANSIINFVNEKIDPVVHPRKFTKAIRKFCKKYPAFISIEKKLQSMRLELLQKIGQECLENLMESDPEQWESLSEELIEGTEDTLGAWMAKLPEDKYQDFTNKVFQPQTV